MLQCRICYVHYLNIYINIRNMNVLQFLFVLKLNNSNIKAQGLWYY